MDSDCFLTTLRRVGWSWEGRATKFASRSTHQTAGLVPAPIGAPWSFSAQTGIIAPDLDTASIYLWKIRSEFARSSLLRYSISCGCREGCAHESAVTNLRCIPW